MSTLSHTGPVSGDTVRFTAPDYAPESWRPFLVVELGGKMVILTEDEVLELHAMLGKSVGFTD